MSFAALIEIIRTEVDETAFQRIEMRIRAELPGINVYVPGRSAVTREDAREAVRRHKGNVDKAAADLGVNRATVYRKLQPQRQQQRLDPGPRLGGRIVR